MLKNPDQIYPVKKGEWVFEEDHVVLLKPKSKFKILRFLWGNYFRIHLDHIGSYMWERMDGKISVLELSKLIEKEFRLDHSTERTEKFLLSLYKNGFVEFLEKLQD